MPVLNCREFLFGFIGVFAIFPNYNCQNAAFYNYEFSNNYDFSNQCLCIFMLGHTNATSCNTIETLNITKFKFNIISIFGHKTILNILQTDTHRTKLTVTDCFKIAL